MLKFEIHLVDNCNLNCAGCSHFSPLAEKNELIPEQFEKNLNKISKNILDNIKCVRLMGGEPLLNKYIKDIIKISRKYFKNANIEIVTNGILLSKMPIDFYYVCKKNNININVTYYNLNIDLSYIFNIIQDYGINIYGNILDNHDNKYFYHYPINLEGTENYEENYINCWCIKDWTCVQLVETKLYCCNIGPYIKYFNKYAKSNIIDNEYLDLSKINNYSEIEQWHKIPKQICKYCNRNNIKTVLWKKSNKNINEWL